MNGEVPEAYGGLGLSCLSHCLLMEEIAWACAGVNTSLSANMLGAMPIIIAGSEEQKQRYLGWLVEPIFASYCCSEPEAGSDVAGMRTHYVKDGDGYVLTGQKRWITNGATPALHGAGDRRSQAGKRSEGEKPQDRLLSSSIAIALGLRSAKKRTRWATAPATPPTSSSTRCGCPKRR